MVGRVCCCRSSDVRSDFKTYKYRDWGVIPLFPPLKICFRDRDCPVPAGFLSRGRICIHLSSSGYWSRGTDICRSSRFFVAPGFRPFPDRRRGYALQTNDYNVGSGALFCGLDVIGQGTTSFPAVWLRPFFPKRSDFGKTLLSLSNLLRRVDGFCSDMGCTDNFKGIVYAILSSSTFGFAPFFTLMLIGGGLSSFEVLFYRWGVASLALGCFGLAVRQNFRIGWRDLGTVCLLGTGPGHDLPEPRDSLPEHSYRGGFFHPLPLSARRGVRHGPFL